MVFAVIRFFPSARQRAQLHEILRSVQDLTIVRPGCLGCWLDDLDSVRRHILYTEQWASDNDLHAHLRSALYHRVLAAMELSQHCPEVNFHHVSVSQGMELIEAVRSRPESASTQDA